MRTRYFIGGILLGAASAIVMGILMVRRDVRCVFREPPYTLL